MAVDIVRSVGSRRRVSPSGLCLRCGVLSRPLTELIEASGKHWVSEIESSRLILWQGSGSGWMGSPSGCAKNILRAFAPKVVTGRNGQKRAIWAFTKTVRLKKYGSKRLVIVHETADLSDAPRFLLTDALHWDSTRTFATWSYRWPIETFHEFAKHLVGFEAAQLRKEEAVKRHFCLSCVAQSLLQATPALGNHLNGLTLLKTTSKPLASGSTPWHEKLCSNSWR
jgi:hypothetical protein